jgi:CheY-like chemotaxis protein
MESPVHLVPTIVIVDDDEGHALLIQDNLLQSGAHFRVERLHDGQQALDFFFGSTQNTQGHASGAFLILLDIRMPRIDGIEVLRRIKLDTVLRKLPVIMLSTADNPREVNRCYELGCSAYVQKPVDYDQFAQTILRLGAFANSWLIPAV